MLQIAMGIARTAGPKILARLGMSAGEAAVTALTGAAAGGALVHFLRKRGFQVPDTEMALFLAEGESTKDVRTQLATEMYGFAGFIYASQHGAQAVIPFRKALSRYERTHGRLALNLALAHFRIVPRTLIELGPNPSADDVAMMVAPTINAVVEAGVTEGKDLFTGENEQTGPEWDELRDAWDICKKAGSELKKIEVSEPDKTEKKAAA